MRPIIRNPKPEHARILKNYGVLYGEIDHSGYDYIIEFDGGTKSNIPPFGNGYGTYSINGKKSKTVKFGIMSANTAEILTLYMALKSIPGVNDTGNPLVSNFHPINILVCGDSTIALRWCSTKRWPFSNSSSVPFKETCLLLQHLIFDNPQWDITRYWRGREHSVRMFGH